MEMSGLGINYEKFTVDDSCGGFYFAIVHKVNNHTIYYIQKPTGNDNQIADDTGAKRT